MEEIKGFIPGFKEWMSWPFEHLQTVSKLSDTNHFKQSLRDANDLMIVSPGLRLSGLPRAKIMVSLRDP